VGLIPFPWTQYKNKANPASILRVPGSLRRLHRCPALSEGILVNKKWRGEAQENWGNNPSS
jgi:hypothetical protein